MSGASGSLRDQQDRPRTTSDRYERPSTEFVGRDGESLLRVDLPGVDPDAIDLRDLFEGLRRRVDDLAESVRDGR